MYNITGKGLVALVSHFVTVRLDDDSFFKALPRLQHMFGITGTALVTFMSHSVMGGLDYDSFFKALPRLQHYSASRARTLSRSCVTP